VPNALKGWTNDVSMIDLLSKLFPLALGLMGRQLGHSSSEWRITR